MPILIGVAALTSPRTVLELGSGLFSTPALNDRVLFPTVQHVHTMEDDAAWADSIDSLGLDPDRWTFERAASIRRRVGEIDLAPYDLIFVDSSMTIAERAATLRNVLERASPSSVVVIHDFEYRAYQKAVPATWQAFPFRAWRPITGVLWRTEVHRASLAKLQNVMLANRNVSPTETAFWREKLSC